MKFVALLIASFTATPATSLDYKDHRAICHAMMAEEGLEKDTEAMATCSCGFDIMSADLGGEVVEISARWAIEDRTFPELTDAYTMDEFYALLSTIEAKVATICSG